MIVEQPADEIAFGERSRAVDDARVDANQRAAVTHRFVGQPVGGDLRALIVVRLERRWRAHRRQREKRRGVEDARDAERGRGVQHVAQPADVHIVEILRPAAPDADERGHVADRVAAARRALDRARDP